MDDMTEPFEMTVAHQDGDEGAVLVELTGELDLHAATTVAKRVDDLLASGPHALHVDGAKLTFVDSAGLRVLLEAKRQADLGGCEYRIVGVSAPLRNLVDITGTAELLPGT
jgi:anti-anti-sigma factor